MLLALLACRPTGLTVTVKADPDLVNHVVLAVASEDAGPIRAECTLAGDPDEVIVATAAEDGHYRRDVDLNGLLADARYACVVTAGELTTEATVDTQPLPDRIPRDMVVTRGDGEMSGAWTLTYHARGDSSDNDAKVLIVDPEGRVRWYFFDDAHDPADLDANVLADGTIVFGGGYATPPTIVDLNGEVLYTAGAAASGGLYNHHVTELPDGQLLTLATTPNEQDGFSWRGFSVEVRDPATDRVTWSWDSQRAVDAGDLPPGTPEEDDPYHCNWVGFVTDDEGPALYASLRQLSRIVRIDRETGEISWWIGPDSDFTLLDPEGNPLGAEEWFYGQHGVDLLLPRMVMYDNGWGRPGSHSSRALEIEVDAPARTVTVTWSDLGGENTWYEPIWGDVDELPNGDFFVTRAHCPTCETANSDHTSLIQEIARDSHAVVWELAWTQTSDLTYRSERVDGCALFQNSRYCPSVLE